MEPESTVQRRWWALAAKMGQTQVGRDLLHCSQLATRLARGQIGLTGRLREVAAGKRDARSRGGGGVDSGGGEIEER
jgi:hypothetical protein